MAGGSDFERPEKPGHRVHHQIRTYQFAPGCHSGGDIRLAGTKKLCWQQSLPASKGRAELNGSGRAVSPHRFADHRQCPVDIVRIVVSMKAEAELAASDRMRDICGDKGFRNRCDDRIRREAMATGIELAKRENMRLAQTTSA